MSKRRRNYKCCVCKDPAEAKVVISVPKRSVTVRMCFECILYPVSVLTPCQAKEMQASLTKSVETP